MKYQERFTFGVLSTVDVYNSEYKKFDMRLSTFDRAAAIEKQRCESIIRRQFYFIYIYLFYLQHRLYNTNNARRYVHLEIG